MLKHQVNRFRAICTACGFVALSDLNLIHYKLIELFVAGVTARKAAELVGVNKNTAAYYFHRLRYLFIKTAHI